MRFESYRAYSVYVLAFMSSPQLRLKTRGGTAMDTLDNYRQIIQKILNEYANSPMLTENYKGN